MKGGPVLHKFTKDYLSIIFLAGLILLLLEIAFFDGSLIFSLLIGAGCIYLGRKRIYKTIGKLLFWFGILFLIITILNMFTFKFLLVVVIIYVLFQVIQSKNKPAYVQPKIIENRKNQTGETIIKRNPLFKNSLFGHKKTPEHVYEWNDMNIQGIYGDMVIDLSNTFLPLGESIIMIRHLIGNVTVLIPYDIEVCVNHSALAGSSSVFGHDDDRIVNQTLIFQTPNYEATEQRIKLVTSMMIGNIEVKRI
jgi:lia operon protein LiaF